MMLSPYYDRPHATLLDYLDQVNSFVGFAYPNWGTTNRGVWAKGEFGRGTLRADHFSILDTQGVWQIPNTSIGTTGSKNSDTKGWIDKALSFKSLEELYTLLTGLQYQVSPLNIVEAQYAIAGITTPVVDHHVLAVLEEPFVYYEEPLVIEPEKTIDWHVRIKTASAALSAEKIRVIGLVVGQHHELIQQTTSSGELN